MGIFYLGGLGVPADEQHRATADLFVKSKARDCRGAERRP